MPATRIFWLGAHKVLKFTELRDMRAMGFEVFNPAYITPVYDQSADLRIDHDQPTTLPPDVFAELLSYNFFYNQITPRIFELLNQYFTGAVVTLNADWLKAFLAGYDGPVVYRVYGQHSPLSETLIHNGTWHRLVDRPGFSIMPFCRESIDDEHRWFVDLCTHVVPYQIPDDVFDRTGSWQQTPKRREIATSIPNIQNPYFAAAYARFNERFPHRIFRIYGPQRDTPVDSRIVGALSRPTLLDRFGAAAGFLYDFRDSVCYLPPIEFMQIGGPVLYAPGSLLSRMYADATPGLVRDQAEAEKKIKYLLAGDTAFVDEVVAAQEVVRQRYDRAVVKPLLAAAFNAIFRQQRSAAPEPSVATLRPPKPAAPAPDTLAILLHIDGLFVHRRGRVYAFEGIPRVVDLIVDVLFRFGTMNFIVTCTTRSEPALHDLFTDPIRSGRLTLVPIDCGHDRHEVDGLPERLHAVEQLNADASIVGVLVPHYYLFPEALLVEAPLIMYLPDYFPHLMPGTVFDGSAEKDAENKRVGVAIAERAAAILTNSRFTASYLAEAGFADPAATKVHVAPLPLLGARRATELADEERRVLAGKLAGRRFLLYPTANRPNKQIAFLLRLLANLRLTEPDLVLVSTCDLHSVPAAASAWARFGLENDVVLMPGVDEGSLRWLYENTAALVLTSTLEGNFPPQVREALEYGAPVVATRLAPITEALGDASDELLLCAPLDLEDFRAKVGIALHDRRAVLERQRGVAEILRRSGSAEAFARSLLAILAPLERLQHRPPAVQEVA